MLAKATSVQVMLIATRMFMKSNISRCVEVDFIDATHVAACYNRVLLCVVNSVCVSIIRYLMTWQLIITITKCNTMYVFYFACYITYICCSSVISLLYK